MEIKYGNEKDAEIQRAGFPHLFHFGEDIGIKHLHAVTGVRKLLDHEWQRGKPEQQIIWEKLRNGCLAMSRRESGLQISAEKKRQEQE